MEEKKSLSNHELYLQYVKDRKRLGLPVLRETTYAAISKIESEVMVELLFTGRKLPIPRLGYFILSKYMPKATGKKLVDYNSTKKYGRVIYYENLHTKGYRAKFSWYRHSYRMGHNITVWCFRLSKPLKRKLAHLLRTDGPFLAKLKELK